MPMPKLSSVAASLGVLALATVMGAAGPGRAADRLDGAALIDALRGGGHVIFIRHAQTEKDYADQISAVMGDCSSQRMLSEMGWRQARDIGAAMASLRIPIAEVYASEYCRAWQTADLAFGRHVKDPALNFEPAEDYTPEQVTRMRDRLAPMLAASPPASFNTVIVGHDDPFEAATGIYPEPQGVTYVLRPDNAGGWAVVGMIPPDGWPDLLAAG